MKQAGTIERWNDEKGFGFIRPEGGTQDYFFHIRSFLNRDERPSVGMIVFFELGQDNQGRMAAINVRIAGSEKFHPSIKAFFVGIVFLSFVGVLALIGRLAEPIFWLYIATSVLSIIFYAIDKAAAQAGRRRTPEATLHNLSLVGGWPGALFAQQLLRHKSKKESFRRRFWITVVINLLLFAYLISPYGSWLNTKISSLFS